MNNFGKTNPKLPFFILETLEKDAFTFRIKANTIFNLVYENLREFYQNLDVGVNGKYDKKKSFTLKKQFYQEYIDIVQCENDKKYGISESEYFRGLLYQYCKLPIFEREKVLFKQNYKVIKEAIHKKKRVRLFLKNSANDGARDIEPYFIERSEEFYYIFGYCLKKKEYRVFRLSHVEKVYMLNEKIEYMDEGTVLEYKENFDPFLSFGKQVIARFTEEGEQKYKTIISNRPKLIKSVDSIYTFECSEKKAQVYFPQFFTTVEILEPHSLRLWYKEQLENALKYYN